MKQSHPTLLSGILVLILMDNFNLLRYFATRDFLRWRVGFRNSSEVSYIIVSYIIVTTICSQLVQPDDKL